MSAERGATAPDAAAAVLAGLRERGETLAFCESLTAGLACATVARVPGASEVLVGGLVTYATRLKAELAGVPEELLRRHGPVAPETAAAMAAGVRARLGADWGVSLTGVAGPGGQGGHPVGEVWIGVAGPGEPTRARRAGEPLLTGDREAIRAGAVDAALAELAARLREAD